MSSLLILEEEVSFDIQNSYAPGSGRPSRPAVLKNEFGDGYRQNIKDGLNNHRRTWNLRVQALSPTEFAELDSFLQARQGYEAFLFVPPAYEGVDPDTLVVTRVRVICPEWDPVLLQGGYADMTMTFEEDFSV